MTFTIPPSFPGHEQNTAKPLAEDSSGIADFLGIPASDSLASVASQYHSALSSPIPCETLETSTERDLISFSSDDLAQFVTYSKPLGRPTSPPCAIALKPPTSPEFSSNRHGSEPLREPEPIPDMDEAGKTTNVYINGLPPHFRDDQLRAIAAPFGEIVSVRCFTRNSTRNPSGYGFILFKTIAAAEKCIVTLKRSDLHPSFSKVNKPPRLVHSPDSPAFSTRPSSSSLGSDQDSPLPSSPELDFKTKMARLEDKSSPNVYIEGLPMSADKNTLMELVYPYIIQSTRFIRSKVPQSQTMIAFMRMETRAAAEESIRRLNGKTIRGWDGAESRVYLRIADTLDQRELRRSEASSRENEPGRLTIAQATLLNYRAKQQLQSTATSASNLPNGLGMPNNQRPADGRVPDPLAAAVHELLTGNPGARAQRVPPPAPLPPPMNRCVPVPDTLPHPLAANIHNLLAQNQSVVWPTPTPFTFPVQADPLYAPYACPLSHPPPPPANMHPNVAALFESLATMQIQQQRHGAQAGPRLPYPPPMAGFPNHFNTNAGVNMQAHALTHKFGNPGGFMRRTPAENFVMQARAEMQLLAGVGANPTPMVNRGLNNIYLPSAPTAFQRPNTIATTLKVPLLQRPAAPQVQPQSFFNPGQSQSQNPSFNAPARNVSPPPSTAPHTITTSTHVSKPSLIDIPQNTNNNILPAMNRNDTGRARQPSFSVGFPSAHARASTAPAPGVSRLQNINNDIDHTLIPVRRERLFTNGNTDTDTITNMNAKPKQNQNQNLLRYAALAPETNSTVKSTPAPPTSTSTRVFLGPQNVVHLPVLRFA